MTCSIISVAERENRDVCKFAGIYTMKSSESCVKKERKKKRKEKKEDLGSLQNLVTGIWICFQF